MGNLRTDNFAIGKLSDEFLASLTDAQLAEISHLMWYEAELQRGISLGQKWVYTNSNEFSPQATTFDHMVASGKYGVNCAMPTGWVVVDLGILNEGQRFWGGSDGVFMRENEVRAQLEEACDVFELEGHPVFQEAYEAGKIESGDMILSHGHTYIWIGDGKFHAAGHDGKWHSDPTAPTEDGAHAVFESWIMDYDNCANKHHRVAHIIRLKKDYVPKNYRNTKGEIVPNI